MIHITGTGSNGQPWKTIHLLAPGTQELLCRRLAEMKHWQTTPEPVTCHDCWRAIQMIAREQVTNLSVAGVEKILDYIALMRNGDIKDANESLG